MTWSLVRLDWLTSVSREVIDPRELGEEEVVHYSIPALDALGGPAVEPASSIASTKLRVRGGEVLVSKLNPRKLRVVTVQRHDRPSMASGEFIPLIPTNVDARFLSYWLRSEQTRQDLDGATQSVTRSHQRVTPDILTKKWLTVPGLPGQRAIADYLDTESARIDALIAKKRHLRDLTVLRSQSTIAFLLDQFKDVPLQHLTDSGRPIVYGIVQAGEHDPEGVPYIKSGDVMALEGRELSRTSRPTHQKYSRSHVRPGDLVIAMRASIGALARIPDSLTEANLTQGTARIAPARGISGSWLYHALKLPRVQEQMSLRAVGSTFRTLNIWDLRRIAIPTPPAVDQPILAAQAYDLERRTGLLSEKLDEQVRLLLEHRQALITAAVTGELKVPGVAA